MRHLAVLDQEELAGIISDRDLKSVLPARVAKPAATATGPVSGGLTAGDIMTKRVITVEPMMSVEVETPQGVRSASGIMAVHPDRSYSRGGKTTTRQPRASKRFNMSANEKPGRARWARRRWPG